MQDGSDKISTFVSSNRLDQAFVAQVSITAYMRNKRKRVKVSKQQGKYDKASGRFIRTWKESFKYAGKRGSRVKASVDSMALQQTPARESLANSAELSDYYPKRRICEAAFCTDLDLANQSDTTSRESLNIASPYAGNLVDYENNVLDYSMPRKRKPQQLEEPDDEACSQLSWDRDYGIEHIDDPPMDIPSTPKYNPWWSC